MGLGIGEFYLLQENQNMFTKWKSSESPEENKHLTWSKY